VSTGAVALRVVVGARVVAVVPLVALGRVVVGAPTAPVVAGAAGFFSPPDETTTATTTPATAATATAAASRAFFTGSEATLAQPCQNRSKTS
jgi:hypothetical protein